MDSEEKDPPQTAAAAESEAAHSLQSHCVCSIKMCFHCNTGTISTILCQVTFIYIALLTILIVSKHLTVSSWRIECQESKIIRLNTQFSVKGISLLNSEMSLSS